MAAEYDINIDQGATFKLCFQWEAGEPPVAVDLTGCSALMHIRTRLRDATPALVASTTNGRIALNNQGNIQLTFSAHDTNLLNMREGVYDLEITLTNGDVIRLVGGKVYVSPQVTR